MPGIGGEIRNGTLLTVAKFDLGATS